MNKSYTLFQFTILNPKKSKKKLKNNKTSLNAIIKRYSKALNSIKLKPNDEVVNNILKYADL